MDEYIQAGVYASERKISGRLKKKMPICGKMIIVFMIMNILLKLATRFFLPAGIVAALCPSVSFAVVFYGIFGKEFRELLKYSFGREKNSRGKVMGSVAKCIFTFVVITLCLGLVVKLTDLTGIDIFSDSIKVSVPIKGFSGIVYGIYMCLVSPFIYELIFRGAVMNNLAVKGENTAVFVSALLFALLHGVYITWIYSFAMGLLLGASSLKAKSLMTSVKVNFITMVLVYGLMMSVNRNIKILYIPLFFVIGFFAVVGMLLTVVEKLSRNKKIKDKVNFSTLTSKWVIIAASLMVAEDILFILLG